MRTRGLLRLIAAYCGGEVVAASLRWPMGTRDGRLAPAPTEAPRESLHRESWSTKMGGPTRPPTAPRSHSRSHLPSLPRSIAPSLPHHESPSVPPSRPLSLARPRSLAAPLPRCAIHFYLSPSPTALRRPPSLNPSLLSPSLTASRPPHSSRFSANADCPGSAGTTHACGGARRRSGEGSCCRGRRLRLRSKGNVTRDSFPCPSSAFITPTPPAK